MYDGTTGLVIGTQELDGGDSVIAGLSTEYDLWGRELKYTNSLGDEPVTSYVEPGDPGAGQVASFTDAAGTIHYAYDGVDALDRNEQRGLVTAMTVSEVGTYTAAYDDQASIVLQTAPGGIQQEYVYDETGQLVTTTISGQVLDENDQPILGEWLSWSREYDAAGRVVRDYQPTAGIASTTEEPTRSYSYDRAGRLIEVKDIVGGEGCVTRAYAFDARGNRLSRTTTAPDAGGECGTGGGVLEEWAYDLSSRVLTAADGFSAYTYDGLGRTLTLPAADAPESAAGDITITYYDSDAVESVTQDGVTTSFTLDPGGGGGVWWRPPPSPTPWSAITPTVATTRRGWSRASAAQQ